MSPIIYLLAVRLVTKASLVNNGKGTFVLFMLFTVLYNLRLWNNPSMSTVSILPMFVYGNPMSCYNLILIYFLSNTSTHLDSSTNYAGENLTRILLSSMSNDIFCRMSLNCVIKLSTYCNIVSITLTISGYYLLSNLANNNSLRKSGRWFNKRYFYSSV